MLYKLLGMIVWNGLKWVVRLKFGSASLRTRLLGGSVLAVALGVVAAVAKARG